MTDKPTQGSEWSPVFVLPIVGGCALILLTLLHLSLPYPFILDDEYRYSQLARFGLVPGSVLAEFPVFLYLATFRWVSTCGEGYLQCARFVNVLFLVASLLPLYRTARLFVDRRLAIVLATFAIASPAYTYTAYFMAETMYFFVFWCLVWFVLAFLRRSPWQLGGGIGALAGLLTLVKPHGLVALAAIALFFLVLAIVRRQSYSALWLGKTVVATGLFFCAARFGLGYLMAGRTGLDLAGAYRSHALPAGGLSTASYEWQAASPIFWSHLGGVILLFSVPLAIGVSQFQLLTKPDPNRPARADLAELSLLTAILFAVFLAVFTKFTIDSERLYPGYSGWTGRTHARYYDFAFPLFLIVTGAFVQWSAAIPGVTSRVLLAVLLSAGIASAFRSFSHDVPFFIDHPWLAWVGAYPRLLLLLAILAVLSMMGWLVNARLAARAFLFGFFPLVAVVAGFFVTKNCLLAYPGTASETGARVAKRLIEPKRVGQGIVVGKDYESAFRALFQLDSQTTRMLVLPPEAAVEPGMIAADRAWALILDQRRVEIPYASRVVLDGPSLLTFAPGILQVSSSSWDGRPVELEFNSGSPWTGLGFHDFDGYCLWSRTDSPMLELPVAVSGNLRVRLLAMGYGPNANRVVKIRLGSGVAELSLPAILEEVEASLTVDTPSSDLAFSGIQPASPADVAGTTDPRMLGFCLRSLSIHAEPFPIR